MKPKAVVLGGDLPSWVETYLHEQWPEWTELSVEKVTVMLRAAGAPEPWARPEALPVLAHELAVMARDRLHSSQSKKPDKLAGKRARAQAAVDELHRVLPPLLAEANWWLPLEEPN